MTTIHSEPEQRRIIMVGKTGNGKSSTANSLLGYEAFTCLRSLNAVTEVCEKRQAFDYIKRRQNIIVDTPGIFDVQTSMCKRAIEIQRSVDMCPNPHAFLLVFSSLNRFTEEERYTIDLLRVIFGEKVFQHCIVIFTSGKHFKTDPEFKRFWTESELIVELVKRCGNRVTRIENYPYDRDVRDQILTMIEDMSENGNKTYNYPWLKVHKKVLEEHMNQHTGAESVGKELEALVKRLGTTLDKEVWKVMLVGGTILGVGVLGFGVAGYGAYVVGSAAVAGSASAASAVIGVVGRGAAVFGGTVISAAWKLATNIKFR